MKDELESLGLAATPEDIKIKKLQKKIAFYQIYTKKLQEKLNKCQEKLKAAKNNESSNTR